MFDALAESDYNNDGRLSADDLLDAASRFTGVSESRLAVIAGQDGYLDQSDIATYLGSDLETAGGLTEEMFELLFPTTDTAESLVPVEVENATVSDADAVWAAVNTNGDMRADGTEIWSYLKTFDANNDDAITADEVANAGLSMQGLGNLAGLAGATDKIEEAYVDRLTTEYVPTDADGNALASGVDRDLFNLVLAPASTTSTDTTASTTTTSS